MTFKERIFFAVASWSWWQRYVATSCVLALLVACWWFLSYRSIVHCLHQTQAQVQQLERAQAALSEAPADLAPEEIAVPELKNQSIEEVFEQRKRAFFALPTMHGVREKINAALAQNQLHYESQLVSGEHPKEWYALQEVNLVLFGKFFNVVNFLERLQKHDNVIVQSCEMSMLENLSTRCMCTLSVAVPQN